MNYLAHAYLSFNDPGILTGNMISDFVKGKRKLEYPLQIQKGIHLHRLIDTFTDIHPVTARAKEFFRADYRLYSGAFVDIVYDHFLALEAKQFGENGGLEVFSRTTYALLDQSAPYFPLEFQKMFPYMKSQNWLYQYSLKEGIQRSFSGLVYRALYLTESDIAFTIFNQHYTELARCYADFFPELKEYALKQMRKLSGG